MTRGDLDLRGTSNERIFDCIHKTGYPALEIKPPGYFNMCHASLLSPAEEKEEISRGDLERGTSNKRIFDCI